MSLRAGPGRGRRSDPDNGESLYGEFQRGLPGRVLERELVPRSGRRSGEDRAMEARRQREASAQRYLVFDSVLSMMTW